MDIYIDPEIEGLVVFMNQMGFRTYASCQGHGIPVHRVKPYIENRFRTYYFTTVNALSQIIWHTLLLVSESVLVYMVSAGCRKTLK
ncbi:hypothetical protein ACE3JA_20000 [Enterobacter hormaechei subsp. xiangfangensis]|uniref:hypothetical protein n=1 Tax=Enterobacteriaceae TaxID=543 RepID=UPI00123A7753|nr:MULTISPECIES: hypothetical protein [Enterobacteriaceae]QFH50582.1 hypothetical protein FR819_15395 [Leclercia adecarboxylata]HEM8794085.1 hypothetical protein [Enterobacter hormaechei]